jgi:phage-related protein
MSDDGVLTINGQQISVFQSSYQIYIDCDTMHAYRITGSSVVSFDAVVTMPDTFVELAMGENTITCTGMNIDLFPRWWRL